MPEPEYSGSSPAIHVFLDSAGESVVPSPPPSDGPQYHGRSHAIRVIPEAPTWDLSSVRGPTYEGPHYHGRSRAIHVRGSRVTIPPPDPIPSCKCCNGGGAGGGACDCGTFLDVGVEWQTGTDFSHPGSSAVVGPDTITLVTSGLDGAYVRIFPGWRLPVEVLFRYDTANVPAANSFVPELRVRLGENGEDARMIFDTITPGGSLLSVGNWGGDPEVSIVTGLTGPHWVRAYFFSDGFPDPFVDPPNGVFKIRVWADGDPEPIGWTIEAPAQDFHDRDDTGMLQFRLNGNSLGSAQTATIDSVQVWAAGIEVNRCTQARFDNFNRTVTAQSGVGPCTWGAGDSGVVWTGSLSGSNPGTAVGVDGENAYFRFDGGDDSCDMQTNSTTPWALTTGFTMSVRFMVESPPASNRLDLECFGMGAANTGWFLDLRSGSNASVMTVIGVETANFTIDDAVWMLLAWEYTPGGVQRLKVYPEADADPGWMLEVAAVDSSTDIGEFDIFADAFTVPAGLRTIRIDYVDIDYAGKPCYRDCTPVLFDDFSNRTIVRSPDSGWGNASSGPVYGNLSPWTYVNGGAGVLEYGPIEGDVGPFSFVAATASPAPGGVTQTFQFRFKASRITADGDGANELRFVWQGMTVFFFMTAEVGSAYMLVTVPGDLAFTGDLVWDADQWYQAKIEMSPAGVKVTRWLDGDPDPGVPDIDLVAVVDHSGRVDEMAWQLYPDNVADDPGGTIIVSIDDVYLTNCVDVVGGSGPASGDCADDCVDVTPPTLPCGGLGGSSGVVDPGDTTIGGSHVIAQSTPGAALTDSFSRSTTWSAFDPDLWGPLADSGQQWTAITSSGTGPVPISKVEVDGTKLVLTDQHNGSLTAGIINNASFGGELFGEYDFGWTTLAAGFDATVDVSFDKYGFSTIDGPRFTVAFHVASLDQLNKALVSAQYVVRRSSDPTQLFLTGLTTALTGPVLLPTLTAGATYRIRLQADGPACGVRVKIWNTSGGEPAGWDGEAPMTDPIRPNAAFVANLAWSGGSTAVPRVLTLDNVSVTPRSPNGHVVVTEDSVTQIGPRTYQLKNSYVPRTIVAFVDHGGYPLTYDYGRYNSRPNIIEDDPIAGIFSFPASISYSPAYNPTITTGTGVTAAYVVPPASTITACGDSPLGIVQGWSNRESAYGVVRIRNNPVNGGGTPDGDYRSTPDDSTNFILSGGGQSPSNGMNEGRNRFFFTHAAPSASATHARLRVQIEADYGLGFRVAGYTGTFIPLHYALRSGAWGAALPNYDDAGAVIASGLVGFSPTGGASGYPNAPIVDVVLPVVGGRVQWVMEIDLDAQTSWTGYDFPSNVIETVSPWPSTELNAHYTAELFFKKPGNTSVGVNRTYDLEFYGGDGTPCGADCPTCSDCADPSNPGFDLPAFTPGFVPHFRKQIGDPTTRLDGFICTLESAAMVLEWHTRGALALWGGELVPWCGKTETQIAASGSNLSNAAQAWSHYGQTLDVRSGQTWADLMAALGEGRAVILQGDYSVFSNAIKCQDSFEGFHAISLYPYQVGGRILVGDPLCSTFNGVPEAALRAYAEALGIVEFGVTSPQKILFAVSRSWVGV